MKKTYNLIEEHMIAGFDYANKEHKKLIDEFREKAKNIGILVFFEAEDIEIEHDKVNYDVLDFNTKYDWNLEKYQEELKHRWMI